jgi:hypothetical protein
VKRFLIRGEHNLIDWIIHLKYFPGLLGNIGDTHDPRFARMSSGRSPDDVGFAHMSWRLCRHDIWKLAAYSGNKKLLEWCNTGCTNTKCFGFVIMGAIDGNQIDILNWSLDHYDKNSDRYLDLMEIEVLILNVAFKGNFEILKRLMTRFTLAKNNTTRGPTLVVETEFGKNGDSFLYFGTLTCVSGLFEGAAVNNHVNILNWFNCRGLLDLPFWQIEEKKKCIQNIILNSKNPLSIETLDLLNKLL